MKFTLIFPDGKRVENLSRKSAQDCLVFAPFGTVIEPPIQSGNPIALNFLDSLIKLANMVQPEK